MLPLASRTVLFGLFVAGCFQQHAYAQEAESRKYALLVGVRDYDRNQLRSLPYPENDVVELGAVLKLSGFRRVALLTQTDGAKTQRFLPTAKNVRTSLAGILEDRTKDDLVLVALAGHGVQFEGEKEHYFCPMDAVLTDRSSLVSLSDVYKQLELSKAGTKLLVVDACRNDPLSGNARAAADVRLESLTRPQLVDPPGGVAALFSCSAGQRAFEDESLKHGVFFHHVILGLKGEARLKNRPEVTWDSLVAHVKAEVPDTVKELFGDTYRQVPEHKGELRGGATLVSPPTAIQKHLEQILQAAHAMAVDGWGTTRALARVSVAMFKSGQEAKAQELIDEALRISEIGNGIGDVVNAQIQMRDFPAARDTAKRIRSPYSRLVQLIEIVESQIQERDEPNARQTLHEAEYAWREVMEDPKNQAENNRSWKYHAVGAFAYGQQLVGDTDEALANARSIEEGFYRSLAQVKLGTALVKRGDKSKASQVLLEAARSLNAKSAYDLQFLCDIAEALATADDTKSAAAILNEGLQLQKNTKTSEFAYAGSLIQLARAQAKIGDVANAIQTIGRIPDADDTAIALRSVALVQADRRDFKSASAMANSIRSQQKVMPDKVNSEAVTAFAGIAEREFPSQVDAAMQSVDNAYQCAKLINDKHSKSLALARLGETYRKLNKTKTAVQILNDARNAAAAYDGNNNLRENALEEIAAQQAAVGDVDGALATTSLIESSFKKGFALGRMADGLTDAVFKQDAR